MSEIIKLIAVSRNKELPNVKYILAEAYGPQTANLHLAIEAKILDKILATAAKSQLIDLEVDGQEPIKVLVKEVQRDPLKNKVIHVDLQIVHPDTKIKTQLEVRHLHESPAVVSKGGILVANMSKLDVECLPNALVSYLEVDLSKLENLGTVVRVEDLVVPEGMVIKNDPRAVLVSILSPRKAQAKQDAQTAEKETQAKETAAAGPAPAEAVAPVEGEAKPEGEAKHKKE